MQISIGFSGPAGSGVNTAGILLAELLAKKGYTVLGDKEYASIIKGDNNCFFLYISDEEQPFIRRQIDYFLAYDPYAVSKNESIYDLKKVFMIKDEKCKYKNTFTLGAALKIFGISLEEGKSLLEQQFSEKEFSPEVINQNFLDLEAGYQYIIQNCGEACDIINCSKAIGTPKQFMYGNELIAKGAIASGLDFYAAYPMTPASSIIDEVVKNPKVSFFQGEDEIAVSMAMLGAKFAGKRAMCGTSGGGFALMTESISFSNQAELGGVYVLAQRDGPSTGTPTFTGQGDVNYALHASFGDTKPIVLYPSTFEEAYSFAGKALNWSDQYQHPVILLSDKQLSESYLSIDPHKLVAEPIKRGKKADSTAEDQFKRYEFSPDGISPYSVPGTEHTTFIATSYEHDEYGSTNEEPTMKGKMMEKRAQKLKTFVEQEFNSDFYGYEIINPDAEIFYITMGINRYALEQHIKGKAEMGLVVIKSLSPFDPRLKTFLDEYEKKIKRLIFVEMNQSGILEDLVRKECELYGEWKSKISHQRKVTLYPIFQEEFTVNS
ncbi:MAG: 2-oxoacid:acceptor oxidoreductase family protein [Candidatus Absconditicoccaceae bacterium]